MVDCRVGSSNPISFLIDSRADVNVIGGADWASLKQQYEAGTANIFVSSNTSKRNLQAYATDKHIVIECGFEAKIEAVGFSKPSIQANFLVVNQGKRSLLGRATASYMELLKVGETVNSFVEPEIFPKMPGIKVKFIIDESVPPVRNAYYNIPAAYRDGAKRRLEEMEARGIIEKVTSAPKDDKWNVSSPKRERRFPFGGEYAGP